MRRAGVCILCLLCSVASAFPASAQDRPSDSEMAAARQLFQSGLRHARQGEWEDARGDFERSYDIAPVPTTLLNLAGAQVQTGQLVAGAESYRRFLSRATSGRAARYREQAETALAAVEERIPRLVIGAHGIREGDLLMVDDAEVSQGVMGMPLPVDPGEHTLRVVRNGEPVAEERVTLAEGEEKRVALDVPAPAELPTVAEASPSEPSSVPLEDAPGEGGSLLASPWLWTGVGAAVVGAVVIALVLASGGEEEPYVGNLGPGMVEFR